MKPHAQPGCSNDGAPNNKDDQKSLMIKKFHLDMIGDLIVKIQKVALGGWLHSASANEYVEVSRNAYMKLDEIKKSNHPILDSSDVFCVQGD